MEQDKRLADLVKEYGIYNAPEGLIEDVMSNIREQPSIPQYKPIVQRGVVYAAILVIIIAAVILNLTNEGSFNDPFFTIPNWELSVPDMSPFLSSGLAAGMVSVFILLLTEYGLKRKKGHKLDNT